MIQPNETPRRTARIAGLWYLLMAVTGPIGLIVVPSITIVPNNSAATAANILASETLFRIGLVSNFVCQIAFVFLVVVLYHLLKDVNRRQALTMVALVLVAVPIEFVNLCYSAAAILLARGDGYLAAILPDQRAALAMLSLSIQEQGRMIAQIFWGLWLLPFGWLALKSEMFPKTLGVLLLIAGVCYVVHCLVFFLLPPYAATVGMIGSVPEGLGEISMILWLLIKGVKDDPRLAA